MKKENLFSLFLYLLPFLLLYSFNSYLKNYGNVDIDKCISTLSYYQPTHLIFQWINFLFILVLIFSFLGARIFVYTFKNTYIRILLSIIFFLGLAYVIFIPKWFESKFVESKNIQLFAIANKINLAPHDEIPVNLYFKGPDINVFIENRNFDVYEVVYTGSNNSKFDILIQEIKIEKSFAEELNSLFKDEQKDIIGKLYLVIAKNNKKLFYFKNKDGNILGRGFRNLD